jgi:PAS domain S-box-containing protein
VIPASDIFRNPFRHGHIRIGRRLSACFVAIVLSMLVSDVIALWQFSRMAASDQRLYRADQISVAVVRIHLDVDAFRDRLSELVARHDTRQFENEATSVRQKFRDDVARARQRLKALPGISEDTSILSALETVHVTLTSQLDAVVDLAATGDWDAVRLRLANQTPALIRASSSLVTTVDQELSQQRAQAIENSRQAQRHLFVVLPLTAVLTLLMAIGLGWYATRSITGPLSGLEAGAQALAHGEFEHEVAVRGRDELATVAEAFNYAARRLRELYNGLRESESRFRTFVDHATDAFFVLDEEGKVVDVNRQACESLGYSREELIGMTPFDFDPDVSPALLEELEQRFNKGEVLTFETRHKRKDGTVFPVEIRIRPFQQGVNSFRLALVRDITDRKQAEQERERLRQLQADLEHIDRVTTMGELTASLAHEINQPITAAVTNARTCVRWLARQVPDIGEALQVAERTAKDAMRAAEIINQIRSLFKKSSPQREFIDINEIINEMVVLLRNEAMQHAVAIRTELAPDLWPAMGDRVQLQQVLMNLIMNSIDAMKNVDGRRELTLKSQSNGGRQLLVSVTDTGVGLPPETDQIFNAFFTTKPEGTGMGLAISRSIIESHGGRLWAAASGGRGATFYFTLPNEMEAHA